MEIDESSICELRRFLPLPDYELSTPTEVQLTIPGAAIDKSYSELLMVRTDPLHASRSDVNDLLLPVLSEVLDDKQKAAKIANLLTKPQRRGVIINRRTRTKPRWELLSASDTQEDS